MTELLTSNMTDSPKRQSQHVVGLIVGGIGDATGIDDGSDATDDRAVRSRDSGGGLDE